MNERAALLACIKANAFHYATYKKWIVGNPNIRGFHMAQHMRDLILLCALFRVYYGKKATR